MSLIGNVSSLSVRLRDKLNAAMQCPEAFAKEAELAGSSLNIDGEDASFEPGTRSSSPLSKDDLNDHETGPLIKSSYRDFSHVLPEKGEIGHPSMVTQNASAKEPTFPVKLAMILSNPEFQDIISWLPHGRSWRILQQKAFEERVIPLYFRHGRYSSFARQVNGWGFRRVTHGSDYNSYYHEMFLRGMPHLCEKMRRLTNKDTASKKRNDDEPAPDFYALSRENPLPDATPAPQPPNRNAGNPNRTAGGLPVMDNSSLERRLLLDRVMLTGLQPGLAQNFAGTTNGGMNMNSVSAWQKPSQPAGLGMIMDGGINTAQNIAPSAQSLQQLLDNNQNMNMLLGMGQTITAPTSGNFQVSAGNQLNFNPFNGGLNV